MSTTNHSTLRVIAHMKSPAILQGHLTLESLLAACVFQETGKMRGEALDLVPIERVETPAGRLWLASAAMVDGRMKVTEHTVVRGRHFSEMGPRYYDPNPRARIDQYACEQDKGDFKRLMNAYPLIEASRLVWYAKGDPAEILRLLHTQPWIGKRRGSGWGEVADYQCLAWEGNPLVDSNGMVRRPLSLEKLKHVPGALPSDRQRVIFTTDEHPSWAAKHCLCAVPPSIKEPRALPTPEMFFED